MLATKTKCWGCECNVRLSAGHHMEPTSMPGVYYHYPCTAARSSVPCDRCGRLYPTDAERTIEEYDGAMNLCWWPKGLCPGVLYD